MLPGCKGHAHAFSAQTTCAWCIPDTYPQISADFRAALAWLEAHGLADAYPVHLLWQIRVIGAQPWHDSGLGEVKLAASVPRHALNDGKALISGRVCMAAMRRDDEGQFIIQGVPTDSHGGQRLFQPLIQGR